MLKKPSNGVHGIFGSLNALKSLMFYSTSTGTVKEHPLVVDYLVKSVGFSQEEAVSICSKVSSPFKSTKKPQIVVDFLQKSGFDDAHIRKVVSSYPKILVNDVEKILQPKIRAFQELGLSGSDLGTLMSTHPFIFSRGLETHIGPALEILKSVFSSHENLVKAMLKTQWLLSSNTCRYLQDNVSLLRSYGVPMEKIENFMVTVPRLLLHSSDWLEYAAKNVEEKLGIPRTSGMFLHGVCVMSSINEEKFKTRIETFRDFGWSEVDISVLIKKHPYCLKVSESRMRLKLKYFMVELGYEPNYLATHGILLLYSTEKRVVPRNYVLQLLRKKQLLKYNPCLFSLAKLNESSFLKRFVAPFKDKVPQLYEDYVNMKRGSLLKQ